MDIYVYIARKAFLREYTYRANVFFTLIRAFLALFIQANLWTALYRGRDAVNGVALDQMILYLLLMTVLRNLSRSDIPDVLNEKNRTGSIASEFVRPVSLMGSSIAEQAGSNAFSTIFATVPLLLAGMLFFRLPTMPLLPFTLFLVTAILGAAIMSLVSWIIGMLSFWTRSAAFGNFLGRALMEIFGGAAVPLWFYPVGLATACKILPFRLALFEPAAIALGRTSPREAFGIIGLQLLWIAVLIALERIIWSQAQKVVTIQGG